MKKEEKKHDTPSQILSTLQRKRQDSTYRRACKRRRGSNVATIEITIVILESVVSIRWGRTPSRRWPRSFDLLQDAVDFRRALAGFLLLRLSAQSIVRERRAYRSRCRTQIGHRNARVWIHGVHMHLDYPRPTTNLLWQCYNEEDDTKSQRWSTESSWACHRPKHCDRARGHQPLRVQAAQVVGFNHIRQYSRPYSQLWTSQIWTTVLYMYVKENRIRFPLAEFPFPLFSV